MNDLAGLQLLRRIEEGVAGKSGDAFFRQIVRDITLALNAHAAFTSSLLPGRRARMLAFWVDGRYEKCINYSLEGTPCEFVYNGQITAFGRDIGEVFPVDRAWFEELGVHSYLGVPIVSETGEVHGHLAVMDKPERDWRDADVDILRLFSLRTAVELERAQAHRMLEEEIEQRRAIEQQLAAAKIAAETANQAKSAFISQMSHELRTPLNGILGYAQLLRRSPQPLTEQQRDGLEIIERSGEHLLNLVNDLLDLAKIEAGKLELRDECVDLASLLQHVADLICVRADKAGLTFEAEIQQLLPQRIRGDTRALRQILLNLLGNAVKFTQPGGSVTLRVRGEPLSPERQHLVFEIADSGVGIPAAELPRIFEPFHRVEHAGRQAEGTGLGLSITHRLVAAMDGQIHVQSEPGRGTTFRIELDATPDVVQPLAAAEARDVVGYSGARRSVLVADDDDVSRALACDLLVNLGFEVRRAADGRSALEQMRRALPDAVITDLVMPHVDGLDLTRAVRANETTRSLPIIAVSASASAYTGQEALDAGCDRFLPKPLRLAALCECLGSLLQIQWLYAATQPATSTPALDLGPFKLEQELAGELYHLAMLGDVTGLMERANATLRDNPEAEPFCRELRALANQYDTGAIRRMLSAQAR
ncbi:MAG TPA: ATP-binding protein [Steroidobacteraceae bacterium]|jgi:signal transduction histidine kinase/ActR/RegA family two-component response regulator